MFKKKKKNEPFVRVPVDEETFRKLMYIRMRVTIDQGGNKVDTETAVAACVSMVYDSLKYSGGNEK